MTRDDRQLLLGIAHGRDDCARELWSRHGTGLMAQARAIVGERAAGDIVQNTLCRILEIPLSKLRSVGDVRAWLATLVRNEAANYLRSERRRTLRERTPRAADSHNDQNEPRTKFAADSAGLWTTVDALPRRMREVIALKLIAGLTFDQIAIALGLNRNTAATRYRNALELIRSSASLREGAFAAEGEIHAR